MSRYKVVNATVFNVVDDYGVVFCECSTSVRADRVLAALESYYPSTLSANNVYKNHLDQIARILHPNANERFAYVPDQLPAMVTKLKRDNDLAKANNVDDLIKRNNQLKEVINSSDQHIRQVEKERDALIKAIRSIPLPDDPKRTIEFNSDTSR